MESKLSVNEDGQKLAIQPGRITGCDFSGPPLIFLDINDAPIDSECPGLNILIENARRKLTTLLASSEPKLKINDIRNPSEIAAQIVALEKKLGNTKSFGTGLLNSLQSLVGSSSKSTIENEDTIKTQIQILKDLNKINQLYPSEIPLGNKTTVIYCNLAESVGGVTEKVCLVRLETVMQQLNKLTSDEQLTVANYLDHRQEFKLTTQAILKLPKHGSIVEVQREAMALDISRLLGLVTTESNTVNYRGQPALFVPFQDIRLLQEFATGKTMHAVLGSTKEYSHYSTINPVGEGLQHDEFVDDFGQALGLMYLCSDTDAIGGYNQNKALRGSSLFIFDQVLMPDDNLALDSRFSMQPVGTWKDTRHGQGRNRTLIEDSSFETKFASIMQLKASGDTLTDYFSGVVIIHNETINRLESELRAAKTQIPPDNSQIKRIAESLEITKDLKKDATTIATVVTQRIKKLNWNNQSLFPLVNQPLSPTADLIKQTLILEKLLNNPVLFKDDGRPYRNPWTQRNELRIESISQDPKNPDQLVITLSKEPSRETLRMIWENSGKKPVEMLFNNGTLIIERNHLLALTETLCFPEHNATFNVKAHYLEHSDLLAIQQGYKEGHRGRIIQAIDNYQAILSSDASLEDKLRCMAKTELQLKEFIADAKDKGFGMHVMKKYQLDMQQKLITMIPSECLPAQLTKAFNAALLLDQPSLFNRLFRTAIEHRQLDSPVYTTFLQTCIDSANRATDHRSAKHLSDDLALNAMSTMPKLTIKQVKVDLSNSIDTIFTVDPQQTQLKQQSKERSVAEEQVKQLTTAQGEQLEDRLTHDTDQIMVKN